ncbi:PD-(D/E)XK nuclease superfamily [uncultured Caudovirales phage]|uniref:PD-(D/E)XK nuclease superfamily n=1 Tax=uncultured Caudovirales phage TaxID=2100421 RepID=A0A6J5P0S1_9CAUD|nr:PD-(D/E)XK nuclease superfamily [uncultured Caudovirales phage]
MSRKTFKHNLVPYVELKTETILGQRYYVLPDGNTKLKSVTTIISEKSDKTALFEWRKRVGEETANRISTQAARRGTSVHAIAERYILNEEDFYKKEMPVNVESFKPIKEILDKHVDNILGIELPLYNKTLGCAGRTDLVAEYDGKLSIIDFKTSRKLKKEEWIENYFIQSTVYAMMFEWIYKIAVPQIVIIITVDDEKTPQTFVMERSKYVDRTLAMFMPPSMYEKTKRI